MENQSERGNTFAWTLVVILTIFLILAICVIFFLINENNSGKEKPFNNIPSPVNFAKPTPSITTLNKQYFFAIHDRTGLKAGEVIFIIKNIERTKEIMIAGQKATALPGRELIILNVEMTNKENLGLAINTRNYLRLRVNNEDKLLAPDFHPDPLDLQPQSTKEIRLGFSIAETDKNVVLQVGELDGTKDLIKLDEI